MKRPPKNKVGYKPFIVWSNRRDPLVPVGIRFVPTRGEYGGSEPWVRAIAMLLDGTERPATSAEISVVTGKQFFQSEARIPLLRLKLWIGGFISDEEAAEGTWSEYRLLYGDQFLREALGVGISRL